MSDHHDDRDDGDGDAHNTPDHHDADRLDGDDAIDRLGRAAGAELRREPPADALARVAVAARRQRITRTATAGAATAAAIAVIAVAVIALRDPGDSRVTENPLHTETTLVTTTSTPPTTTGSPATTTEPRPIEPAGVPERTGTETTVEPAPLETVTVPEPDGTATTVGAATSTEPDSATLTEPGPTPPAAGEPISIGPGAEFIWGDGVVLGSYDADGSFVPYDAERFSATPLPDPTSSWDEVPAVPPTGLLDRTGTPYDFVMYDEGCGAIIASPAFTPFPDAASGGWMATAGHPFATLDGQGDEVDPETLDAAILEALRATGIADDELDALGELLDSDTGHEALLFDGDAFERVTPAVSLDGDPSLETLVYRYDLDRVSTHDVETIVWFAVWDPDTALLVTIAGDPGGDVTPFAVNGEGPIDVDGDGNLEITIRSGTGVELVRLSDGERIARAERCPVTLEVSATFAGFGGEPVDYTISVTSSEQTFTGEAAGEDGHVGPFVFDLPLGLTGTYVVVETPAGRVEFEALLRAGHSIVQIDVTPDIGQM